MWKYFKWVIFFFLMIIIAGYLFLPRLNVERESATKIMCVNNLKRIGLAMRFYSSKYDDEFPPYDGVKGLELLRTSVFLTDSKVFICPAGNTTPALPETPLTEETVDYDYIAGKNEASSVDLGIACDKAHNHEQYGNILFVDGHVKGYAGIKWKLYMDASSVPPIIKTKQEIRISCSSNLKQIGLAIRMYADKHDGQYPPYDGAKGLELLLSTGFLSNPQVFVCPSSNTAPATLGTPLTEAVVDYEYIGGKNNASSTNSGIAFDKAHNHDKYGNTLFVDGHVRGYAGVSWMNSAGISKEKKSNNSNTRD